ncbi:MAG: flagellar basal body FlgE domain-containing protein [Ferruginibacter sp.]
MKKPFLLFAIKCAVILYFAACTSIEDYTIAKAAAPVVTKGSWKVNVYVDGANDQSNAFAGYTLTFNASGDLKATKNGTDISGNWAEDHISKRVTLDLGSSDPVLSKLNRYWTITDVTNAQVDFVNTENSSQIKLAITSL